MNESTRHYYYIGVGVLIVLLILIDVFRGGDAAAWVTYLVGGAGISAAGLAAKNTSAR